MYQTNHYKPGEEPKIEGLEEAKAAGWEVVFQNLNYANPNDNYQFKRDDGKFYEVIWWVKDHWVRAFLGRVTYEGHRSFKTLKEGVSWVRDEPVVWQRSLKK